MVAFQSLLQREKVAALDLLITMNQVDREVLVRVRPRETVFPGSGDRAARGGRRAAAG